MLSRRRVMSQKIKIAIDISQIKKKVGEVKAAITSLWVNTTKITFGGKKLKNDIKETTAATKELNRTIQQTGRSATNSTAKFSNGLKAMTTEAKGAIGFTKNLVQSFITPWTIAIIAVETLAKTFKYFWDNLTENIQKATARGNSSIKSAERQIKKTQQRTKSINDLIGKLEQLNKLEELSDEQKSVGASLINRLNKEYKVFGITLDETTGKYQGLYQARMKVDAQSREQEAQAIRKQISGQRQVVNATLKEVLGSGLELGKSINGKDLFTLAERITGTMGAENADLLAKRWGRGNDLYAIRDVIQQLMDGLTDRSNTADLQRIIDEINELIDYYQKLQNVNSISRASADSAQRLSNAFDEQRKAIKATREEVEKLNEQYQKGQQKEQFDALNPREQVKVLQDQIKALEQRNKAIEEANNKNKTKLQFSKSFTDERRQIVEDNYAQQQALKDRIEARKKANKELEQTIRTIEIKYEEIPQNSWNNNFYETFKKNPKEAIATANLAYHDAVQGLSVHQYSNQDKLAATKMKRFVDQYMKVVQDAEKQISQNNKLNFIDQKQIDFLVASVEQAEIDAKEYSDILYQTEQDIANAELERIQNLNTIAEKKKQQAQLAKQIAEEQERAVEAARQNSRLIAQQQQNAQQSLASIAEKGQIQMLRKQGKNKEADVKERESIVKTLTKQIETQLGRPLGEKDQALRNSIEAGADIQMALKGIEIQKPNVQNDQVFSNELARMGGFSSSIVVDRMDVSKQILDVNKKANDNLNTIASSVQKIYDNTTL